MQHSSSVFDAREELSRRHGFPFVVELPAHSPSHHADQYGYSEHEEERVEENAEHVSEYAANRFVGGADTI